MLEQFSRTSMLIGAEALNVLGKSRVAVIGVGGVGSYTVEALARTGVGRFLLVDDDTVDITNINRQLHATLDTLGKYKTLLMKDRILSINAEAVAETREIFCMPDNIAAVLNGELDYIVDAVDTVSAKLAIIEYAQNRGIPVISAMGAGNKLDASRFEAADINSTSVCPLCRVMRRELKKRGITALKVVYSKEPPVKAEAATDARERPVPGSVAFVPGVAGLIIAGEVVMDLIARSGRQIKLNI